jgi:hypothetical protein
VEAPYRHQYRILGELTSPFAAKILVKHQMHHTGFKGENFTFFFQELEHDRIKLLRRIHNKMK